MAVLDDIILQDVAKSCGAQFRNYHECILAPDGDAKKCLPLQDELQNCVKNDVPSFQRIQKNCATKIAEFESCLKKGSSISCSDQLKALRSCALQQVESSKSSQ
ncbi:hypothetical protein OGAPHI_004605 [Ogataea philodendri]|uniref:IMS import disulfide relay-system CHCH-CHCH-like Cx9C domain-containing protein n=1 Tax=Ogataea philodendri TaxID=1378263 RepID=A0A9P8P1U1_9ASCO|nr:uncharacterized protein OGAPHI_004605 [Ogataea philodendri]KAH3664253.1 hypothetical protein OGAPHI_004605 [Ogataea philodendri]